MQALQCHESDLMYVCIHVCMNVCIYVCMDESLQCYMQALQSHESDLMFMLEEINARIHAYMCIRTHTNKVTKQFSGQSDPDVLRMHMCIHTYIHTYIRVTHTYTSTPNHSNLDDLRMQAHHFYMLARSARITLSRKKPIRPIAQKHRNNLITDKHKWSARVI